MILRSRSSSENEDQIVTICDEQSDEQQTRYPLIDSGSLKFKDVLHFCPLGEATQYFIEKLKNTLSRTFPHRIDAAAITVNYSDW